MTRPVKILSQGRQPARADHQIKDVLLPFSWQSNEARLSARWDRRAEESDKIMRIGRGSDLVVPLVGGT